MKHAQVQILDVSILYAERGPEFAIACPCFAAAVGLAWKFVLLQRDGCLLLKIGPFRLYWSSEFGHRSGLA